MHLPIHHVGDEILYLNDQQHRAAHQIQKQEYEVLLIAFRHILTGLSDCAMINVSEKMTLCIFGRGWFITIRTDGVGYKGESQELYILSTK